jgi:hypothetical protein
MPPFGFTVFLLDVFIAGAHSHPRIPRRSRPDGKPLGIVIGVALVNYRPLLPMRG